MREGVDKIVQLTFRNQFFDILKDKADYLFN